MTATTSSNFTVGVNSGPVTIEASDWPAVPTVFFDGSCPLCQREIAHYRRSRHADRLAWIDVSSDQATLEAHGLSRQDAMERLHVLDATGNWQTGAWAFAELWSHLPRYRLLAGLLRHSGLLPPLDRVYNVFARWRSRRRCDALACSAPSAATSGEVTGLGQAAQTERHGRFSSLSAEGRPCV